MSAIAAMVFGWLTALVTVERSWAEERPPVSDLQRILDRNKLVIAVLQDDYPPLFATTNTGRLVGSHISLVEHLAQELGVKAEFMRQAASFDAIIELVSQGHADIGLSTTLTLSRAKKVLFSQPYMTLNLALLLNRVKLIESGISSELREIAQLRHTSQKIGLLVGSAYLEYARKSFPLAELIEYKTLSGLYAAVENGELLAAVRNDLTAQLYLSRNPASLVRLRLLVDPIAKDVLAFSVRPDSPHLLHWINAYLVLHQIRLNPRDVIDEYRRTDKSKSD